MFEGKLCKEKKFYGSCLAHGPGQFNRRALKDPRAPRWYIMEWKSSDGAWIPFSPMTKTSQAKSCWSHLCLDPNPKETKM
jgi:hypothetical protein